MDPKDIERLPKKDRLTGKISQRMVEEIIGKLKGMKDGTVHILVKNSYILGIETTQRVHFTSKRQAEEER